MKKLILILSYNVIFFSLSAQTDSIKIKDLEIPTSPGFILLDETPTSIESPASAKSFVLNIVNSLESSENGFPNNYAVEFSPFWWFKSSDMTTFNYLGLTKGDSTKQNIFHQIKTTSLSSAIVSKVDTITSETNNNLVFGLRSNIISIRSDKQKKAIHKKYGEIIETNKQIAREITRRIAELDFDAEDFDEKKQSISKEIANKYESEKDKISLENILAEKPIFGVSAAFAYNRVFMNSNVDDNRFGKMGVWLTTHYSHKFNKEKSNYLNAYVLTRLINDGNTLMDGEFENTLFVDIGAKIEFEFSKFKFSYEYIARNSEMIDTHRSNGLIEYKIYDNLKLTGAFGKNFGDQNNLISILGINWGFQSINNTAKVKN